MGKNIHSPKTQSGGGAADDGNVVKLCVIIQRLTGQSTAYVKQCGDEDIQ